MYKKTLYEQLFDEYDNHKGFWSYYGNDTNNPFTSKEAAKEFLEAYFVCGSKGEAIRSWVQNKNMRLEERNMHMVVAFFIGVMLQRRIDASIAIISQCGDTPYPFKYYWFLTCLAHDIGYLYEEGISKGIAKTITRRHEEYFDSDVGCSSCVSGRKRESRAHLYSKEFSVNRYLKINGCFPAIPLESCQYKIRNVCRAELEEGDKCERKCPRLGGVLFSNQTKVKNGWYCPLIIERYFRYRLRKMDTFDHGIVGADKFYSDLINNYKSEFENNRIKGSFCSFLNRENKHFSCEQFKVFAYIANCIAAHNVFMAEGEKKQEEYEDYGLECLFKENFRKISYQDDPLLFILCVADTIEPTKRFDDLEAHDILDYISINYSVKSNKLFVHVDSDFLNKHCSSGPGKEKYIKYENGVNSLGTWCDIEAKVIVSDNINKKSNRG